MVKINPGVPEEVIPDGWYTATLGNVELIETKDYGEKLVMPFEVEGPNGAVEIKMWSLWSDSPLSNIVKLGAPLVGGRIFDTDEISGVKCEVFVIEGEYKGTPKNYIQKTRLPKGQQPRKTKEETDAELSEIPF